MIAVIARLTAKPGQGAALEKTLRALGEQVRANEAGCKLYQLCTSQTPDEIVVIERYESQAALDTHGNTPHFRAAFQELGQLLGKSPAIEVLNEL
jgi:quinol monooxygenase YgiN